MVATVSIDFVRHDSEIRSIETDRPLRHPAHPCNTLACSIAGPTEFSSLAIGRLSADPRGHNRARLLISGKTGTAPQWSSVTTVRERHSWGPEPAARLSRRIGTAVSLPDRSV